MVWAKNAGLLPNVVFLYCEIVFDFEGKTTLNCRGSHLSLKTQIAFVDISQGICAVKKKSVNNLAIE